METRYSGGRIKRKEDPRLISGAGRYIADVSLPGCLEVAFLRSPHAHARIVRCDAPSGVFCGADLPAGLQRAVPPALAVGAVHYVGEPVAVTVAEDRYAAEDRLEAVQVEYETRPVVLGLEEALAPGAAPVRQGLESNVCASFDMRWGDVEAAFGPGNVVARGRLEIHRASAHPLEGRGLVAAPDAETGGLIVWAASQGAHGLRRGLAAMLGLPEHRVRVITPDVGGGFGVKNALYAEYAAVAWLALKLRRPLRWIEDRREHFFACQHEREAVFEGEVAARRDGTLLGLRVRYITDSGAYGWRGGPLVGWRTMVSLQGPYRLPAADIHGDVVLTNKTPTGPYRGAGRPQANFVMERLMDRLAEALGTDRAEVRRRNLIRPEEMPYTTGMDAERGKVIYDSGDYPQCLERALAAIGWAEFPAEQRRARAAGRYLGIGIACYNEDCGGGPFESARVRVDSQGKVVCYSGAPSQGQGHETAFAQILADELGVPLEDVSIVSADTATVPLGIGTFGSRGLPTGGGAVSEAGRKVREKILRIAARRLEAAPEDLVLAEGRVQVKGAPQRAMTLVEVSRLANQTPGALPAGMDPGLEETAYFRPERSCYANGTNACMVEVDPVTGAVEIKRYIIVHDCGRIINPLLVEGQIHGGEMYGLSTALLEELVYDEGGQLVTASFMDYLIPTATEVPRYEIEHMETPTPLNPLGAKGAGEGGTIPSPEALASAVEDALAPFGARVTVLPMSPARLRALVEQGQAGQAAV